MKDLILILDEDKEYSRKFCSQATKLLGEKYNFINIQSAKEIKGYTDKGIVESLIMSYSFLNDVDDEHINSIYVVNEENKLVKREGKKTFVYKLQNVKKILELVDKAIASKKEKGSSKATLDSSLILFYSPCYIKNKLEFIKKLAKHISKNKKVLIIDLDEFSNYKGTVGLSNVIYNYKENNTNEESLRKEIVTEKDQDYLYSITYPEDFNVVTNMDLANIVNDYRRLKYDYIFVNADSSYVKCQYILNDSSNVILIKDKEDDRFDKFKTYLKSENQVDIKKITEFDIGKVDRAYVTAFCKQCFESRTA